jgi:DNA-binding CsgD family transcriptional regulator
MDRLAASEFRRIHGFLRTALDADGDDAFPAPVLEALRRLVPCDVVSYGHYAAQGRRWGIRAAPEGVIPIPGSVSEASIRLQAQDPFLPSPRTLGRAVRVSDLLTPAEFHALDFYQEVGRPLGIEYSMQLWLMRHEEIVGGFGFDAEAADFSERDRAVLDFLAPDLLRLHQRATSRRRFASETDAITVLTNREREVVRLVAAGLTNVEIAQTLFISPGTVRKHLDNVYARLGVSSRAAAVAVAVRPV